MDNPTVLTQVDDLGVVFVRFGQQPDLALRIDLTDESVDIEFLAKAMGDSFITSRGLEVGASLNRANKKVRARAEQLHQRQQKLIASGKLDKDKAVKNKKLIDRALDEMKALAVTQLQEVRLHVINLALLSIADVVRLDDDDNVTEEIGALWVSDEDGLTIPNLTIIYDEVSPDYWKQSKRNQAHEAQGLPRLNPLDETNPTERMLAYLIMMRKSDIVFNINFENVLPQIIDQVADAGISAQLDSSSKKKEKPPKTRAATLDSDSRAKTKRRNNKQQ